MMSTSTARAESQGSGGSSGYSDREIQTLVDSWVKNGWLREIDRALARLVYAQTSRPHPLLLLATALVSHQLGRGIPYLRLDRLLTEPEATLGFAQPADTPAIGLPSTTGPDLSWFHSRGLSLEAWLEVLNASEAVTTNAGEGPDNPLVLDDSRLYLRRYKRYELAIKLAQRQRLNCVLPAAQGPAGLDLLRRLIEAVFDNRGQATGHTDWQRIAVATAIRHGFCIITGGPGTGKTTAVVRLLAVTQSLALGANGEEYNEASPLRGRALRIGLAAPTGKAAARLNEAMASALTSIDFSALPDGQTVRSAITPNAVTVHRLVGAHRDGGGYRHNRFRPLPLDVLVIDEASMLDLELMAAICDALPPSARIVLLGDKDQLASVEAGLGLESLCPNADRGHYTPDTTDWIEAATGQRIGAEFVNPDGDLRDQAVIKLRYSHRFRDSSGIGALATAVNAGDSTAARKCLTIGHRDVSLISASPSEPDALAGSGYQPYLRLMHGSRPHTHASASEWDEWAAQVIKAFSKFRLLCAVRQGNASVDEINQYVRRALSVQGLVPATGDWYAGRPVMVTQNDHTLNLMNGDVGIALAGAPGYPNPGGGSPLRVAFLTDAQSGTVRWILPGRLRTVQTAFSVTVHKAQGSEFDHAVLVLPEAWNPILSRELIYTAITRAREHFSLIEVRGSQTLERAIQSPTVR